MILHSSTILIAILLLLSSSTKAITPHLRRGLVDPENLPVLNSEDIIPSQPPYNYDVMNHFNENCDPSPCPDATFCGIDGQCHAYSCDAWYTLGPPFFTNYTKGVSEDLVCDDNSDMDRTYRDQSPMCGDDWPVAVEFLTGDNIVSRQCPMEDIPHVSFRRKCTARPTPDTTLVCYDMGTTTLPVATERQAEPDYLQHYLEDIGGRTGRHVYSLSVMAPSYGIFLPLGDYNETELNTTVLQSSMGCSLRNSQPGDKPFGYCDENGGCRVHEFCGRDKTCHSIDCDNLYQYGPVSMVGEQEYFDSSNSGGASQLTCALYNEEEENVIIGNDTSGIYHDICQDDEWPTALEYKCSPRNIWSGASDACPQKSKSDGRLLSFARRCLGQPNPDQIFLCYDMKGVSLADYTADYVQLVTENPNCTKENLDSFLGPERFGDWPMCPQEEPNCLTARHEMTNRLYGDGYSTNLYWRKMSEDALAYPLNLDALDKALYSRLYGWRRPDPWDSDDDSGCGPWRFGSSVMVATAAFVVACVL